VLFALTALSGLLRFLSLASVLLLVGGALQPVRKRFPALRRLEAWRVGIVPAIILTWLLGSGATGLRDWLEVRGSLEVSQGPDGELIQKASPLGLQRGLRGAGAELITVAREAFQSGEQAMVARRYREGEEAYERSVRVIPTMAGYLNLGLTRLYLEDFRPAEAAFRAGLDIARRAGDARGAGACLDGIGRAALGQGHLEEALASQKAALGVHVEIGDMAGRAITHANIANVYRQQGRLDEALLAHREAFALYTRTRNLLGRADALDRISDIYRRLGRLDEALRASREALSLDQELSNDPGQARDLEGIAEVYLAQGERRAALDALKQTLAVYRRAGVVSKRTQAADRLVGQLQAALGGG
jgi:tetratricopeptide (TPR) repeat protein